MNILLFRGGMCGDMIAALLDPSIYKKMSIEISDDDDVVLDGVFKNVRNRLKNFWKYDTATKVRYVNRLRSIPGNHIVLSHDTDFSNEYFKDDTIQIVCSDHEMLKWFSRRFEAKHSYQAIEKSYSQIDKKFNNFVEDYAYSILRWQATHNFSRRLDVRNIRTPRFIGELKEIFPYLDTERAKKMHDYWLALNS